MKKHKFILIIVFIIVATLVYTLNLTVYNHTVNIQIGKGHPSKGGSKIQEQSHIMVGGGNPVTDFLSSYQTSIEFYGKVVDQHGEPVSGATVKIFPFDDSSEDSHSKMVLTSDAKGLFSVKGLKGIAMGVQVNKEGCLSRPDLGFDKPSSAHRIEYGLNDDKGARFKDPNNPTLFTLYKLGQLEPMVYVESKRWHLPIEGTPRIIALDTSLGTGTHQIEFRFVSSWKQVLPEKIYYPFDWKLEASIPGGGFCRSPSAYAFEAPESGYEDKIIMDYPEKMPKGSWERTTSRRYFVKFADGTYGRIGFGIDGAADENSGPLMMQSWLCINPGSRNLESDKWDPTEVSE